MSVPDEVGAEGIAAGWVALDSGLGRRVIAATVAGSAVAMLTATVVNVALPALAADLDAASSQQQWVVNAYLLTVASLILIGGSLGDRYGRLRVFRIGVAWFGLASLACAAATNVEMLIGARLLQGLGGALLTPGSLAIINATLRRDDRGRGVGQWSGLGAIAGAAGPIVGGLLVDVSWRWVFVVNIPIAAVALALSVAIPESADREADGTDLDVLGAILAVSALSGTSYALIEGPAGGWSGVELAAGALATLSLAVLVVVERSREHAMVPVRLFADRTFAVANLITVLVYGGMGVVFFLLTIQLQVTSGFSPLAAGAALLPITLLMFFLSSRAGDLAHRVGPRWPLTIGPALIAIGMVLHMRIGPDATYVADVLPGIAVFGLGLSLSVAPVTAAVLDSVPDNKSGAASGVNNSVSRMGQLLAVAAIPSLAGLTGDALNNPAMLDAGFGTAMAASAALVALGGLASAAFLPSIDTGGAADRQRADARDRRPPPCCPVDGAPVVVGTVASRT